MTGWIGVRPGRGARLAHERAEMERALLRWLLDGREHYPLDVWRQSGQTMPRHWVYRLLREMAERGLVRMSLRKRDATRLQRTYSITDAGRAVLESWAGSEQAAQERANSLGGAHQLRPSMRDQLADKP